MCIFCKIIAGEIPANKVLENDEFLAFNDINPIAPVHILVIPKKHIKSFNEVDGETIAKMTEFIKEVAKKAGIFEDGYRIITNINENGGQEVPHLHFHVLGGTKLAWPKLG
jgi:histidine triad (HIT) family protein